MPDYRQIYCRIWDDEWFHELTSDAKVVWLYLLTNLRASVAGIYRINAQTIAYETNVPESVVNDILEAFCIDGKIEMERNVIWVKKMRKYQATTSWKLQTRVNADVQDIPESAIKRNYIAYYRNDSDTVSDRGSDYTVRTVQDSTVQDNTIQTVRSDAEFSGELEDFPNDPLLAWWSRTSLLPIVPRDREMNLRLTLRDDWNPTLAIAAAVICYEKARDNGTLVNSLAYMEKAILRALVSKELPSSNGAKKPKGFS